ncbi:MAG TPA: hypothetical protein PLV92_12870 [Pirellulaceae bacterium]|nr:hypothetical protein [Pirellulaceae bacterium]
MQVKQTRPAWFTRLSSAFAAEASSLPALLLLTFFLLAFATHGGQVASAQDDLPAPPPLQWFKGNLHTHSLWSDGNDFPEMIVDWYVRQGYHFLALSDHNILSEGEKWIDVEATVKRGAIGGLDRYRKRFGDEWVQTRNKDGKQQVRLKPLQDFRTMFEQPGKFLLLQGEELTDRFEDLPVHVNASNIRDLIKPQGGKSLRETIANNLIAVQQQAQRVGQPILAHLNHPNFHYAVTAEDMAAVVEEQFFEVYNGHPDVGHRGDKNRIGTERMWDVANTIRVGEMQTAPLYGLATDDSHNYFGERGASPGRGWIMVHSRRLNPSALIQAIGRGEFYASSGVELKSVKYDAESKLLTIDIARRNGATYVTEFIGTLKDYDRKNEPAVDEKGQPIRATRRYSADVGKVLAKVEGLQPAYQLTGDELYVRAVVTSTEKPTNPAFEGQFQQAWTQPVGFEKWVKPAPAKGPDASKSDAEKGDAPKAEAPKPSAPTKTEAPK